MRVKRVGDTIKRVLNMVQIALQAVIQFQQQVGRLLKALGDSAELTSSSLAEQERTYSAESQNREWHVPATHRNLLGPTPTLPRGRLATTYRPPPLPTIIRLWGKQESTHYLQSSSAHCRALSSLPALRRSRHGPAGGLAESAATRDRARCDSSTA